MAVFATIIVKLSKITLRKEFGLMGSNLQHKDACRVILRQQRAAPLCLVESRRRMELDRQQLAWAFVTDMTDSGTWWARVSFRCCTTRAGTLGTPLG
jgi:hypothetical protein